MGNGRGEAAPFFTSLQSSFKVQTLLGFHLHGKVCMLVTRQSEEEIVEGLRNELGASDTCYGKKACICNIFHRVSFCKCVACGGFLLQVLINNV